jgi:hypothetical protein
MIEVDPTIPKMSAASSVSPTVRCTDDVLYLAYFGPSEHMSVVLRFGRVHDWDYGYPNDEGLNAHPLFGHGLKFYEFHLGPVGRGGVRVWIGTFHDGTFTIYAETVEVLQRAYAGTPAEALDAVVGAGTSRDLDAED